MLDLDPITESMSTYNGPNHKDGCDGKDYRYSGSGYNRVRICDCGAEDHDPEPQVITFLRDRWICGNKLNLKDKP